MDIVDIREFCLSLDHSCETLPFDDVSLVFKVGVNKQKMFALISIESPNYLCLKCEPNRALELRERHWEINGAFHFNKRHWNGIDLRGTLSDSDIREMIMHSYELVRVSLPKNSFISGVEKCAK